MTSYYIPYRIDIAFNLNFLKFLVYIIIDTYIAHTTYIYVEYTTDLYNDDDLDR